jgi:hypothetical protein
LIPLLLRLFLPTMVTENHLHEALLSYLLIRRRHIGEAIFSQQ